MTTRIRKAFELSFIQRAALPAGIVIGALGGYSLEAFFGKSVSESLLSGALLGGFGGVAGFVARLEDYDEETPRIQ
ncbi:MAG: hypothetical protein H6799_02720 [Candidatus Nomurabacteria bacterium]|nr:MAG: hypothetical protein H6799_02720 [Candidatus Nomurabacteria bacterium]HRV75838.1 hypothetical protein [Candidatus Saccharimonadales bacterium]